MRKTLAVGLMAMFTGCSPYQAPADAYLQSVFDKLTIALAYERVCEKSPPQGGMDKNIHGNKALIEQMWGAEIKISHPEWDENKITNLIKARHIIIDGRISDVLDAEDGCQSVAGQDAQKIRDALKESPPENFKAMLEGNIEKLKSAPSSGTPEDSTPPETR